MTDLEEMQARIRMALAYFDKPQPDVVKMLPFSSATLRRLNGISRDGQRMPRIDELHAIAAVCGVPPDFLEHGFAPYYLSDDVGGNVWAAIGELRAELRAEVESIAELRAEIAELRAEVESIAELRGEIESIAELRAEVESIAELVDRTTGPTAERGEGPAPSLRAPKGADPSTIPEDRSGQSTPEATDMRESA